ncbi:hypothetical protein GmHk_15G044358 [Glycine max]|nr:hypothetical protein GmHk_15G044358 [Glycine max]
MGGLHIVALRWCKQSQGWAQVMLEGLASTSDLEVDMTLDVEGRWRDWCATICTSECGGIVVRRQWWSLMVSVVSVDVDGTI